MGRRLNVSQPTVIKTEMTPLTDLFDITPSDSLEQWYYVNTGDYKPDRTETPLILTPTIKAVDEASGQLYYPTFQNVVWYCLDPSNTTNYSSDEFWPGLGYVRITAVTDGDNVDYFCPSEDNPSRRLVVKKNVPPPTGGVGGVTLCCVATYIDPRDSGVTYMVRKVISLATNQDASVNELTISLQVPPSQKFNVFTSASSLFDIEAKVLDSNNRNVTSSYYIEWYGVLNASTTEVLLNTLLCYSQVTQPTGKGQGENIVRVDAMFAESLSIVCRIRKTSSSALLPPKAYTSIVWDLPKIDAYTVCKNGSSVDSRKRIMNFETVVNIKSGTLTDAQKLTHLLVNYKRRISTSSSFTNMGWGQSLEVHSDTLKQTTSFSTPVHSEVYLLGAYEVVTDDSANVTDNGEVVYDRL